MRGRWDHVSPEGHQDTPRDNTSRYVYAQVSRWLRTDELIHPEIAMEIAAWWHSPAQRDTAITMFAGRGYVAIHGVDGWDSGAGRGDDLSDQLRWRLGQPGHIAADMLPLRALAAYVDGITHAATAYRRSIWHGGGHRWMSTDTVDEGSCLTCGVLATLRPERESGGDYGCYYGGDGELIIYCTGRTDLVHGYPGERHCQDANGLPCEASVAYDGTGDDCAHIEHVCNCLQCN